MQRLHKEGKVKNMLTIYDIHIHSSHLSNILDFKIFLGIKRIAEIFHYFDLYMDRAVIDSLHCAFP